MKKVIIVLIVLLTVILLFYLWQKGAMWCNPRFTNPDNSSSLICSLVSAPLKSGYEGRSCLEKNDCGKGYCVYNEREQAGICKDNPQGCVEVINKKDESVKPSICFD